MAIILLYRTKVCRTKFSTDKIFRRTKFSTPSRNFDTFVRFLPDFCIETLDKIFDGQNFSSDKTFDTKSKFRQFCPTKFCPIRYPRKQRFLIRMYQKHLWLFFGRNIRMLKLDKKISIFIKKACMLGRISQELILLNVRCIFHD